MKRFLVPLGIFAVMVGFLYVGLGLDPRELPSPLVDKPAPNFTLPVLSDLNKQFTPADAKGKVWLLNVWASWCESCRYEHPLFVELSRQGIVAIYGLNYKDTPTDARNWLAQYGDPYDLSISDFKGDVGIDYGVYGVPETFLIDKDGVIRYKHIGPVDRKAMNEILIPKIRELQG